MGAVVGMRDGTSDGNVDGKDVGTFDGTTEIDGFIDGMLEVEGFVVGHLFRHLSQLYFFHKLIIIHHNFRYSN